MTRRHATLVAIVMVAVVACSSGSQPTPEASSGPQTTPALAVDTVAVVVADDVMERELPRPELSDLNEWPLPRGLQLYVVGGPVRAGGSEWYQVVGLAEDYDGFGWVRAASPSGEPWITPLVDAPDCPDTPSTVTDLARLTTGIRLACFSGVPIAAQALLYTDGWTANPDDPGMAGVTSDPPDALALITLMDPQAGEIDLALVLDPASVPPDVMSFETAVEMSPGAMSPVFEVTGMFDHPDAAGCMWNEREAERVGPEPDPPYCRPVFVVTGIEPTSARSTGPGYQEPVEVTAGGTATLELTADAGFAPVGNGPITCWAGSDTVSLSHFVADDLGEVRGGTLVLFLALEAGGARNGTGDLSLWIELPNTAVGLEQPGWEGSPAVTLNDDQVSGTVEFQGLTMSPDVVDRVRAQWPSSLSGKLTWQCEPW